MADALRFLGTGDALGVPRVYCDCPVCTEARTTGANRRTRCSAMVETSSGAFLLDCGADWRIQMEALQRRHVDTVLLTHAHHDHIGGLPDLYDAARWHKQPVRLIGPARVLREALERWPWLDRALDLADLSGGEEVGGYAVQAWEVCHGRNGRSFAYRFERPGYAWAYCPDAINLSGEERAPLRGLDLLVLGTAYYNEPAPMATRSLYSMVEALDLLADVTPAHTVFTHLSHGVDATSDYGLPAGVQVAHDGLTMALRT